MAITSCSSPDQFHRSFFSQRAMNNRFLVVTMFTFFSEVLSKPVKTPSGDLKGFKALVLARPWRAAGEPGSSDRFPKQGRIQEGDGVGDSGSGPLYFLGTPKPHKEGDLSVLKRFLSAFLSPPSSVPAPDRRWGIQVSN